MTTGPTQGADDTSAEWTAAPGIALSIRATVTLVPLIVSWIVVRALGHRFYAPDRAFGVALWILQALLVGYVVSIGVHRITRRFLPLATLYNVSLVFPDEAPSRFSVALRSGTLPKLRRQAKIHPPRVDDPSINREELVVYAADLMGQLSRHDRLTRGHAERVRAYSMLIAQEMNLSKEDQAALTWGALLHDVGKLDVPQVILDKRSKPTASEWARLQSHPAAARRRLEPLIPWLGDWVLGASEHHERWDGDGYPSKLQGHDISLCGRIVAVADAYDVITSKRSYKSPKSTEYARKEIVRCAGTQFDPEVVRAFLNLSLGRRGVLGPFAGLLDLPRLVPIVAGGPAMAAGSLAAAAVLAPSVVSRPLMSVDVGSTTESRADRESDISFENFDAADFISQRVVGNGAGSTAAKDEAARLTGRSTLQVDGSDAATPRWVLTETDPTSTIPGTTIPSSPIGTDPTVSVPTTSVPTISVPPVSVPPISVPILPTEPIEVPVITVPSVTLPVVSVPTVTVPKIPVPTPTAAPTNGLNIDLGVVDVSVGGGGIGLGIG